MTTRQHMTAADIEFGREFPATGNPALITVPARVEDAIIEAQHAEIEAARPRFRAGMRETVKARDPRLVKMWTRDYAVRPGLPWAFNNDVPYSWTQFETDSYAEAVEAVKGYLFCGAPYVTLHYYSVNGRTETVETWRAQ